MMYKVTKESTFFAVGEGVVTARGYYDWFKVKVTNNRGDYLRRGDNSGVYPMSVYWDNLIEYKVKNKIGGELL